MWAQNHAALRSRPTVVVPGRTATRQYILLWVHTSPKRSLRCCCKLQVRRWHGIGQPHAIGALVKSIAIAMHPCRIDVQHHGFAMAAAHGFCRCLVGAEVYVVAPALMQSLLQYGADEFACRAMKEYRRRHLWNVSQLNGYGMSLAGPDTAAIGAEGKTLFVVVGNNGGEHRFIDGMTLLLQCMQQQRYLYPTACIGLQAQHIGAMPQYQRQQFAVANQFFGSGHN